MRRLRSRPLLAPALALVVVGVVATTVGPTSDIRVNDLFVYRSYADLLFAGRYPYLDFPFEYPPLALVPLALGGIAGTGQQVYTVAFGALTLAAGLCLLWLTARLAGRRGAAAAWVVALSPLLAGAMLRTHFDVFPLVLVLAALLAFVRDRALLGFALLGVGTMTKLFPALLVPVAVAWLLAGGRPGAGRGIAVFAAVVVALSLPFVGDGYVDAYRYQLDRPVQIESTPATVLFAIGGSDVTGRPGHVDRYKSNGLIGGAAPEVEAVFGVLLLLTLAAITVLTSRAPPDRRTLLLGSFAAVLAFAALGKVLSPQFMIWLVPFAALAWACRERSLAGLSLAAIGLTQLEFPMRYTQLVDQQTDLIVLVAVRNGVLLAALAVTLARLAGPARSRRPASAGTR